MLSDTENTSNVSHFSKIISGEVDKIINVPVMSISETNGIAGCIYNMTIPNIDNWRRFAQGSRFGAESLAEIYANPNHRKESGFQFNGWSHRAICRWTAASTELRDSSCDAVCKQGPGRFGCHRVEVFRTVARTRQSACDRPDGCLCRLMPVRSAWVTQRRIGSR